MTPRVEAGTKPGARSTAARATGPGIAVDEEQRRRLSECCAFFRAARFRPTAPGAYRKRDLAQAKARIDAIVDRYRPK